MVRTFWILCCGTVLLLAVLLRPAAASGEQDEIHPWDMDAASGALLAQNKAADEFSEADLDALYAEAEAGVTRIADPFMGLNKAMFTVNDRVYFWILKPVAQGYRTVLPSSVRGWIKNFFYNLQTPARFTNCILQGKGMAARNEFARFVFNSTAGVLGFGNPAGKYRELNPPPEDLGQTLGIYGIGNGFYLVWPLIGPSTLRDTAGRVGDIFLDPVSYLDSTEAGVAAYTLRTVNETSFRIGDYETLKEAFLEPYEAFRDAYIQNRRKQVAE